MGSMVVPFLSLNVYQYPPRSPTGMFWLLPSSPSSIIPSGPQSLNPGGSTTGPEGEAATGAGAGSAAAAAAGSAGAAAAGWPIEAADPGAAVGAWGGGITQPSPASETPAPTNRNFFIESRVMSESSFR